MLPRMILTLSVLSGHRKRCPLYHGALHVPHSQPRQPKATGGRDLVTFLGCIYRGHTHIPYLYLSICLHFDLSLSIAPMTTNKKSIQVFKSFLLSSSMTLDRIFLSQEPGREGVTFMRFELVLACTLMERLSERFRSAKEHADLTVFPWMGLRQFSKTILSKLGRP